MSLIDLLIENNKKPIGSIKDELLGEVFVFPYTVGQVKEVDEADTRGDTERVKTFFRIRAKDASGNHLFKPADHSSLDCIPWVRLTAIVREMEKFDSSAEEVEKKS